jgi:hypothetical protein
MGAYTVRFLHAIGGLIFFIGELTLRRQQGVDEGGIPTMADLAERRYTPGKPAPNHVEFIAAVGSDLWICHLVWTGDIAKKYGEPETKIAQIENFLEYFQKLHGRRLQPHIFYIDARWGSVLLMEKIDNMRFYGVLSCSAKMRPQGLMTWMRGDLSKGDWWCVGLPKAHANLVTIHTKKKVYLNLLTNYGSVAAAPMEKKRRKFPTTNYVIAAPWVQKNYNDYKCGVDKWNKAVREYYRTSRFINEEVTYTQFFIHAYVVQSWVYWQGSTGRTLSQLEFRKALMEEVVAALESTQPEHSLVPKHWPQKMTVSHRCQYHPCHSMCTSKCPKCDKWGCLPCLQKAHLGQ